MMIVLEVLGVLLKIIGILLLAVLLLFLALAVILLLVPLRYKAELEKEGGDFAAQAEVSYLLRLVRLPVRFQDKKLDYRLKVLCFTLLESDGKKKRKPRKKPAKAAHDAGEGSREEGEKGEKGDAAQEVENQETESADDGKKGGTEGENLKRENLENPESMDGNGNPEGAAQENIFEKLWNRFLLKIEAIKKKIQGILSIFRGLEKKLGIIREFLGDAGNKNGIKYAGKTIFKLLKHIFPYKMEGEVVFGTGDPYSMGQVLSVLGIFYAVYAKRLKVEADFATGSFRLDGRISLKGRIRMGSMLFLLLRLWFQGKLKKVLANFKKLADDIRMEA